MKYVKIKYLILVFLATILIPINVFATNKVNLKVDKTDLEIGDEITVSANIPKDIDAYALLATLKYDKNVFQKIDDSNFSVDELSSISYNDDTNKFGIINKSGKISTGGKLFTINLKVKADANVGDTNIALTNISYSDGNNKKTLESSTVKISVTRDAKDNETIPTNKENKIKEDKEEIIVVFPTMKVIIALGILAFILLLAIIYINSKNDEKKKSLYYLIGLEIIIILLIMTLFIFNINKKDVNKDGKKDYKDAEEIIDYLIDIEGTKTTEDDKSTESIDNTTSNNNSNSNIKNKGKSSTSVRSSKNYDVNNDGKVDIEDAGHSAGTVTKNTTVSLRKTKDDNDEDYYVSKGKITLKFSAEINPSDLKIIKVKIGNKYYDVEYNNGVYTVLVDDYNEDGLHNFVINGVKLSNGEERGTNLMIEKEVLKDVPKINIESKQEKYEDMDLKFDLDDNDNSLTSASIVIFKGTVTEEDIRRALEGPGILDRYDENGNEIESDDFDNFEEVYEKSFSPSDFPVTLNLKEQGLKLGEIYTVVVFGEYDLDSNPDNKKNNYQKEIIKDSPKTIAIGNLKFENKNTEDVYLNKNEEYKFSFDALFEPKQIEQTIVRAIIDGEEKIVEIEDDTYFINLTATDSPGSKTFHISEVVLADGTHMLCDYDINYEVLKDEPKIEDFIYHKKSNKVTFTLKDLDNATTKATIKITNKNDNRKVFSEELDLNDKEFSFDNIDLKEENIYNVVIEYSYDLDRDNTNNKNNYEKTFEHELTIYKVELENANDGKKDYHVKKGEDVTLKFSTTITPQNDNAKITQVTIGNKVYDVTAGEDGIYSVNITAPTEAGENIYTLKNIMLNDEELTKTLDLKVDVLKDAPKIENLLVDESKAIPEISFDFKDLDNAAENTTLIVTKDDGTTKEFEITKEGSNKIELKNFAEELENKGGVFDLEIKSDYHLDPDKQEDNYKHENEDLIEKRQIKIYHATLNSESYKKYVSKEEVVDYLINAVISPNDPDVTIKSFVLKDNSVIDASDNEGTKYSMQLKSPNKAGKTTYEIEKIILSNGIEINANTSIEIEVLKDVPYVNKMNLSYRNDSISYELADEDKAFISGRVEIYDKSGTKVAEDNIEKAETGPITGIIKHSFNDGELYTVKVVGSYDLDSSENGLNEEKDTVMSSESFVVGGDYNFKLTDATITDSLQANERPVVSFKSTNTRGAIIDKANLTNDNNEPINYNVVKQEKDYYEITLNNAQMTPGRHTVTLDSVSMDNSLKTFENEKDYNTNKLTYTVLKDKPKVDELTLTNNKDDKTIKATFKLIDKFESTNKLTVVLVDSTNKIISTHEITKEELNIGEDIDVSLSYKRNTNASTAEGSYTVRILADYDLADQYKYKNINLKEENILTTTNDDIYIQDMYITNNNNERLDNNVYQNKGEQNFQIAFVIYVGDSVQNIAKEKWGKDYNYNNFQSITINGLNYPVSDVKSEENIYTIKAKMEVPNKAGILTIKANRVQLGIKGYYNMNKTDWYSVAEKKLTIDVLKDKPKIENLIINDDYNKQEAIVDFDVILDETESKENFTGNIKLGDKTDSIEEGHNTKTIKNIKQNEIFDLIFTGNYDLDTNELNDTTGDNKNYFNEDVLHEVKYGLYNQNTYNDISIENDKIISEKGNKYFEKNEKIKLNFDISKIPEDLKALGEKVIIDGKKYPLNVTDDGYELILDGYSSSGEKKITITDIILSNGKKVTLQSSHTFKIEVLKDIPAINDFAYEKVNDKIKVTLDLKDYDNSLIGKCKVIITDEAGNEVYNEKLEDSFTFERSDKNNLKYYITVVNDYDRDIDKKKDSDNYNKNIILLDEIISLEKNNIELKDITDINLYKSNNDKITLEDTVDVDTLKKDKDKYFVEISMENMPTVRAKIDEIITTDNILTLTLKCEYITREGAKAKTIRVEFGSIKDNIAKNTAHPKDAFKALLEKLEAGQDVDLNQNYDASSIEDTDNATYVTTEYKGTLNGNGYTIKNLSKPLFNKIIKDGKVDNLILKDVDLGKKGRGALANQTNGAKVSNIIVNNVIKNGAAEGQNGGLIGLAKENTTIENCGVKNANINVSGGYFQQNGGLAGCTENSTVTNSYATGRVYNGFNFTASLVGNALGSTITNCYTNVIVSGDKSCDLACSYDNPSTYINNIALGSGGNNGFANSDKIREAKNNYYVKYGDSTNPEIKHITTEDVNNKLFTVDGMFSDKVWVLNDDISYENNPILQIEKISNLGDIDNDGYDETKETLYANLLKLTPYYDSDKIIEVAENVKDEQLINNKIVHIVPVDENGNLVTYLTSENPKKISKIKIVFNTGTTKEYPVSYEKTYDMVATYKINELGIDYNYNHYVINSSSQVVNNLTNYLKGLDYTNNLDILTTNDDSRIYRDFYNETTKNELKEFVLKYLSNSNYTNTLDDDAINSYIEREVKKNQKIEKALYVYNYFRRFYDLDIDGMKAYDFIMFDMQGFYEGLTFNKITDLYFSDTTGANFNTNETNTKYNNLLSSYTNLKNLSSFLEYIVTHFSGEDMNNWVKNQFKGILVEIPVEANKDIQYTLWDHFSHEDANYKDTRYAVYNYILPILTLPENAGYIISAPAQFTIGAQRVYMGNPTDPTELADFNKKLQAYTDRITSYYNTAYSILKDVNLFNDIHLYQIDKRSTKDENGAGVYNNPYSTEEPFHKNFDEVVNLWPANQGVNAGNWGDRIEWNVAGFMDTPLKTDGTLDEGHPTFMTWSHETAHYIDARLFLKNNGRRFDAGGEDYADAFLMQEFSENGIVMNLTVNYQQGLHVASNLRPERINSKEKIHDFYSKMFKAIYAIDYIEAEAFKKLTDEQKAEIGIQISYPNESKYTNPGNKFRAQLVSKYSQLSKEDWSKIKLDDIDDFIDNKIMIYPGIYKEASRGDNSYGGEGINVAHWYQPNNPYGRPDSYALKWLSYEMLGYKGYDEGFVEYASNINPTTQDISKEVDNPEKGTNTINNYKTDNMAISTITNYSSVDEYKKARFKETADNLKHLNYIDVEKYAQKLYEALVQDANEMKGKVENAIKYGTQAGTEEACRNYYWCNVNLAAARGYANSTKVRQEMYYILKNSTNDFDEDIYSDEINQTITFNIKTTE